MHLRTRMRLRISFAALAAATVLILLVWQYFHGGIVSHHVLHRADMPAVSNAWAILLVPLLAWWTSGRIWTESGTAVARDRKAIVRLVAAIVFGAVLAAAFEFGYDVVSRYQMLGACLLAIVLPLYRVEYVFGFVLGMMITFGAVLPAIVGAVVAVWSALWHRLLWPGFGVVIERLRRHSTGTNAGRRTWR